MTKNADKKRNLTPYLVRKGTAKEKTLRTHIKGGNHREIMITTQGYDNEITRNRAEEIALEALFKDPKLKKLSDALVEERNKKIVSIGGEKPNK